MASLSGGGWRRPVAITLLVVVGLLPPLGIRADILNALIIAFYYVICLLYTSPSPRDS